MLASPDGVRRAATAGAADVDGQGRGAPAGPFPAAQAAALHEILPLYTLSSNDRFSHDKATLELGYRPGPVPDHPGYRHLAAPAAADSDAVKRKKPPQRIAAAFSCSAVRGQVAHGDEGVPVPLAAMVYSLMWIGLLPHIGIKPPRSAAGVSLAEGNGQGFEQAGSPLELASLDAVEFFSKS